MRVFAISDLHLSINNPKPMDIFGPAWDNYVENIIEDWNSKVNEDDLVLMAGDFSWAMALEDTKKDFDLLKDLKGKKIIIRGNHDYWWKGISAVREFLPEGFYAIQNDAIKFGNIIVCGTRGWTFPNGEPADEKIFNREVIRLELTLKQAFAMKEEGDKIVCMMHYPPVNARREDSEFSRLLKTYQVDAVIFGHLHGYKTMQLKFFKDEIPYYLTSCDMVGNKLIEISEV